MNVAPSWCSRVVLALLLGAGADCSGAAPDATPTRGAAASSGPVCPLAPVPATRPPGTLLRHERVEFWLRDGSDEPWLSREEMQAINTAAYGIEAGPRPLDTRDGVRPGDSMRAIEQRIASMSQAWQEGRWREREPGALAVAIAQARSSTALDHIRLVRYETPLRCLPLRSGLFEIPVDVAFDRNACSSLHPGEAVRVLRRSADGAWLYVRTSYAVGWVEPLGLGPRLAQEVWDRWQASPQWVPTRDDLRSEDGFPLRLGVSFPMLRIDPELEILVPGEDGPTRAVVAQPHAIAAPPWTRREVFRVAFSLLGQPYGWGGYHGQRDCSRFLRDVFFTFGLQLARHSSVQARQGVQSLDVDGLSDSAKLEVIRDAARSSIVVLYMPGHVMLYLGEDAGQHYAISALSEWIEPCDGGPETVFRIDRVAVSTLELGRSTSRRAFVERITRVVVFGRRSQYGRLHEGQDGLARVEHGAQGIGR